LDSPKCPKCPNAKEDMYVKMFKSIFDGSLYGQFEPTVVFMAMLVIAEREGIVDMTPEAIAARCGYPIDIVLRGISELEKPDPRSRTPDEDGRRIIKLEDNRDWGWRITNYEKYEKIRSAEERREYFRLKKREQRSKGVSTNNVHTVHQCPPPNLNLHPKPQPERIRNQRERRSLKTLSESVTEKIPEFSNLVRKLTA
jgi:hypothetical protein